MLLLLATLFSPAFAGPYTVTELPAPVATHAFYASNEIQVTWYSAYPRVVIPVSQYDATDFFESEVMPSCTKVSGDLWHFALLSTIVADAPYSEILVDLRKHQVSVVVDGKVITLTRDPSGSRGNTESFMVSQNH